MWNLDDEITNDLDDMRSGERSRSARILVADDEPDMCLLLGTFLCDQGYRVCEARSGTELLRLLRSTEIDAYPMDGVDLVIMDYRMPGYTGLEILQKVRAVQWDTPIIVMTGYPDEHVIAQVRKLGATLLGKPFELDALGRAVRKALSEERSADTARLRIPS